MVRCIDCGQLENGICQWLHEEVDEDTQTWDMRCHFFVPIQTDKS